MYIWQHWYTIKENFFWKLLLYNGRYFSHLSHVQTLFSLGNLSHMNKIQFFRFVIFCQRLIMMFCCFLNSLQTSMYGKKAIFPGFGYFWSKLYFHVSCFFYLFYWEKCHHKYVTNWPNFKVNLNDHVTWCSTLTWVKW